jgi:hypothetical protein
MKAINIDGAIKTYNNLKSFGGALGLQYSSDNDLEALGFYNVVKPSISPSEELGAIEWDSNNNVFTYPIVSKTFSQSLEEMKQEKIAFLKSLYNQKLAKTDWKVIKAQELGESISQTDLDARAALRAECNTKEVEINALNTKIKVNDYFLPSIL